jgi:hypothetical protein
VQFIMPSFPSDSDEWEKRRLLTLYATLHTTMHSSKFSSGTPNALKITHHRSTTYAALGWITPAFEIYAVAPATAERAAVARAAEGVGRWVAREEGRLFLVGGAVF